MYIICFLIMVLTFSAVPVLYYLKNHDNKSIFAMVSTTIRFTIRMCVKTIIIGASAMALLLYANDTTIFVVSMGVIIACTWYIISTFIHK